MRLPRCSPSIAPLCCRPPRSPGGCSCRPAGRLAAPSRPWSAARRCRGSSPASFLRTASSSGTCTAPPKRPCGPPALALRTRSVSASRSTTRSCGSSMAARTSARPACRASFASAVAASRFVADPFGDGTLYRTGDRARWLSDGTLEHLGRLDFQVKLRGFRIEPGEIEARIAHHPAVREVVVVLRDDGLVAYFAGDNEIVDELRALLRAELPEYMVPTYFVAMETLPLTHNGKIDRRLLPPPAGAGMARRGAAAARTPTEEMVMGEFRRVLGRQDFGVEDDFFDLGGHSLLAARLMSGLRKVSGCNLPLRYPFERPTVGGLAEAIDGLAWLGKSRAPSRHPANREEIEL